MIMAQEVRFSDDFKSWRAQARRLLDAEVDPSQVVFSCSSDDQTSFESLLPSETKKVLHHSYRVPQEFVVQAKSASAFRDPKCWPLFYRILWRLTHEEPQLMQITIDPDIELLTTMVRSVRRDIHKMTAFVRFRELKKLDAERNLKTWFVAWHEPDHKILRQAAPFFIERFNGMCFSILTPDASLHWDGLSAEFSAGCTRAQAPRGDDVEALWKIYYASVFNPARIKERAMKNEMAVRYWKNLPEAALIPDLIRNAPARLQEFYKNQVVGVEAWMPPAQTRNLESLRLAAQKCRGCTICEKATQTVFGEGPVHASVVVVGEQPGDQEDRQGRPFVGPAGQLLNRALTEAGINREEIYLTNAVKHFKWTASERTRLHQKPSSAEIAACKPWLTAELESIAPKILLCLGTSAAQSVLGKAITLREVRGHWIRSSVCDLTRVTIHPSAILRATDPIEKTKQYDWLVEDLRACRAYG